jgi:hypothetical protein
MKEEEEVLRTCQLDRVVEAAFQLQVEALLLLLEDDGSNPAQEVGVVVADPSFGSVAALGLI